MADCEWAILCDYTFRDQAGKVCLIGIFTRIWTKNVPATHHQAAIVVHFVGEPNEEIDFRIEIVRPTGGLIGKLEGKGRLSPDGTADINQNIGMLPIPDFGTYAVQVFVSNELAKAGVTFVVAKTAEGQEPTRPT